MVVSVTIDVNDLMMMMITTTGRENAATVVLPAF